MGDLEALLAYLRGGPSPTPNQRPHPARAVLDYLIGFSPTVGSDVFCLTDPMPFLLETKALLRRAFNRFFRASEASRR
jgi:hypothetical protein